MAMSEALSIHRQLVALHAEIERLLDSAVAQPGERSTLLHAALLKLRELARQLSKLKRVIEKA